MTATIENTGTLREVRGPLVGLPHLLKMRRDPVGHNDYARARWGEVIKLNVLGTTMYACYGMDASEKIL